MTHELKCWPKFFQEILEGKKTHEIRKADRDFNVGDVLWLREYIPIDSPETINGVNVGYTGRELHAVVTYISRGFSAPGLLRDYCVMSIALRGYIEGNSIKDTDV